MVPWVLIDAADIPGGGELRLLRRGDEFSIMLGANELMNSRKSGSEEALAQLSIAKLKTPVPSVLVGGLGMGFTLRAALDALPRNAEVHVAELLHSVVDWAKGPLSSVVGASLYDPRVRLTVADVRAVIAKAPLRYDAILLDVDNGPDGLVRAENNALYSADGLRAAHWALRDGGILAVWSAHEDQRFTRRLKASGYSVEISTSRAHGKRGAKHTIWFAAKS